MEYDLIRTFDSYCRTVIRNAAIDYYESLARRREREACLEWVEAIHHDTYFSHPTLIPVFDFFVPISNPWVLNALMRLPRINRDIILAHCCAGWSDQKVSEHLNMARRTVNHRRKQSIAYLQELLQDGRAIDQACC